jgi:hypothetical protein
MSEIRKSLAIKWQSWGHPPGAIMGQGVRTFLNRQFFRHELIHVSQILKNPNLWSTPGWRAVHEPVQLLTAHWWIGWPAIIYFRDDIIVTTEWFIGIFGNEGE